jgi:hypothetical protein
VNWNRLLLAALLVFGVASALAAEEIEFPLPSGNVLSLVRYPSAGDGLLVWVASERGLAPAERQAALELSGLGIEVWQLDLASGLFLPPAPASLDGIEARDMQAIFARVQATGSVVNVYAIGRAAVPVLRGLAANPGLKARVLLMHPNFYARADALDGAEYLPFGSLAHLDVMLLQPRRSAATPWVENQVAALRQMGASTALRMLERLREGFWVREDATDHEISQAGELSTYLMNWMKEPL